MYQYQLPSDDGDYDNLFEASSDEGLGITDNSSSLNSQKGGLLFPPRSTSATTGPSSRFRGSGGLGPNNGLFIDPNRNPFLEPPNTSGLTGSSTGTLTPSSLHGNPTSANVPKVGPNKRFDVSGGGNPGKTTARPYQGASRDRLFNDRGGKFVEVNTVDTANNVGQMNKERDPVGNQSATPDAGETGQTYPQDQQHGVFNGAEELKASPRQGNAAAPGGDPGDDGGSDDGDDNGAKKDGNAEGNNGSNKGEWDGRRDNGDKPADHRNRENNGSMNGGDNEESNTTSINNTGDNNNTERNTNTGNTGRGKISSGNTDSGNNICGNNNVGGSDDGPRISPEPKFEPPYPGWRPDPKLLYEDYQIRMGEGWTMSDQTYEQQPLKKRRKIDIPYSQLINHTFRSMNGLSTL
ncbi:hypothetical protein DL764_001381 [Monosporascus ibericus]|uniref:Uncharacterized protein n=1 Tax=Monosporascus ibericus TaxID=155417 RepID=A0A4Q4TSC8_9PEZI|nr:hypothetical protein DL764_001381 [Monosporascus ibericus]